MDRYVDVDYWIDGYAEGEDSAPPPTFDYLDPRYGARHRAHGGVEHAASVAVHHRKRRTVTNER